MGNLLKSIIVFIIAYFAIKYLLFFGIGYALVTILFKKKQDYEPTFSKFLWDLSLSIDQTLNVCLQFILNDLMKYPKGAIFGNPDETISGVTGKNQRLNNLTWFGKCVNWFLNKLEKDHSIKAIEEDE